MIGTAITIIITLLIIAQFYLKQTVITSLCLLLSCFTGMITAFGFYHYPASFMISRGFLTAWMSGLSFIFLFGAGFGICYAVSSQLAGANIKFGEIPKVGATLVCGLITGVIVSGCFIIFITFLPMRPNIPYARFNPESANLSNPKSMLIPSDKIVTGLFGWISEGSLSTKKNFNEVNAEFLDRLHLSRVMAKEGVYPVAGNEAIAIANTRENDKGQIAIELGISDDDIKEGGGRSPDGNISFVLAQARVLCESNSNPDDVKVIYPVAYVLDKYVQAEPLDVVEFERSHISSKRPLGRAAWIRLVYDLPSGYKPAVLQFKQNAIARVPKPSEDDEETPKQQ
jgi:hypothetical protein